MAGCDARSFHRARAEGDSVTSVLVLGGARSGKSRYAEGLAKGHKVYIATAEAFDDEMRARIGEHRRRRGDDWENVEEPLDLLSALLKHDAARRFILVDCLTLWLSNLMHAQKDVRGEVGRLTDFLLGCKARVVLVSNEVGQGIVPDHALARVFRDEQGWCNQRVAEATDEVVMMIAGLPMRLKKPKRKQR
jgi:adenosylcobinamide kinase / adenosylcobinamide-phosphate guanylyltransferase